MRRLFFVLNLAMIFSSCSKDLYGKYNTNYSTDKSVFFEVKLSPDSSVEKTEIHTISISAEGRFVVTGKRIVCFFDSSSGFPPDILAFKLKGKKLYFIRNGNLNKKAYLIKE